MPRRAALHCERDLVDNFRRETSVTLPFMLQEISPSAAECDPAEGAFCAYVGWARSIARELQGICLLDGSLEVLEVWGTLKDEPCAARVRESGWLSGGSLEPIRDVTAGVLRVLLPLASAEGELLGTLALASTCGCLEEAPDFAAALQPLLVCLCRHLEADRARQTAMQLLTERTADLQWLLELPGPAQQAPGGRSCLHALLAAATARMRCALGVLYLPENHFSLLQSGAAIPDEECAELWQRSRVQMTAWVRQKRRPLVLNGRSGTVVPRCKILLAPIVADSGPVLGVLAFFRPSEASDFRQRHLLLVGHLGRLAAGIVDAQFDSVTGLYTREGLDQVYSRVLGANDDGCHSVLYLDVDQMHVVNELYGFEIGNELLVRVADLLAPPQLPDNALAARIAADRFAVLLPDTDTPVATVLAQQLQERISRLAIGPVDNPIDVSVSGGVAALLMLPQGLARALAAAELACKTAKKRGRNRIKVDTCDDGTMLRRHVDAVTVGQLRAALKADQLVLYAQRIEPLRDRALPGGYEILVRLNDPTEGIVLPGTLVAVAERYQMLPAIDRWVVRKTFQTLAANRAVLEDSGLGISINLSGQSIGDEAFVRQLGEELRAAQLPPGSITFEITEQAAVSSLARAEEMIRRLAPWNCRFALDDFGTGANSLTYLNALPIGRVKIDGSFVRDILTNPRSEGTVRGIVELARGFSIDTVAEFVESRAIAERVGELGVDYAQGYAFGRPEPLEGVLEGLKQDDSPRLLLEA